MTPILFFRRRRSPNMPDLEEPWGSLTRREVYECLLPGTLPVKLCTWAQLGPAIRLLPTDLQDHIRAVAATKKLGAQEKKRQANMKRLAVRCAARREAKRAAVAAGNLQPDRPFRVQEIEGDYLEVPNEEAKKACITAFIDATGNHALSRAVCVVCAQELMRHEGGSQ